MGKAHKTNYYDPMGRAKTGYIIDGKTYKDEEGKERIEMGSTVETADGLYTLTSSGGVKNNQTRDAFKETENRISQMKKDSKRQQEALYNAKKADIDSKKRTVENDYKKAAKNAYLQSMQSEKNINQILKAQGINGGMSESRILANKLNYENIVNDLRQKRDDSKWDLDNQLLALRNETDYNIAAQNAEYDKIYLEYADKNLDRLSNELMKEKTLNSQNYNNILNYERDIFENDRDYALDVDKLNWDIAESWRNFNQDIYEYEEKLAQEQAQFEQQMALDREKFAHDIADDERNYNLNVTKVNKSGSKSSGSGNSNSYKKDLDNAELLAKYGDFSAYANLYGWNDDTLNNIQDEWKKKQKE